MIYIHRVTRPYYFPSVEVEELEPLVIRNVSYRKPSFGRVWFSDTSRRKPSTTWRTVGSLDEVSSRSYDVLYNEGRDSFKLKRQRSRDFNFDVLSL